MKIQIKLKHIFLSLLLYCCILLIGVTVIYAVQYNYHYDLRNTAINAAKEWSATGKISEEISPLHECVFFVSKENAKPVLLHSDTNHSIFQHFIQKFAADHDSSQSYYQLTVQWKPFNIFATASSPVYTDGLFTGNLYVIRTISYLPSIAITFLLFFTIIYCILLMHLCFIHKINGRVTNIYRKYISNISHELKTPVASIHAITETLNAGLVNDEETLHKYYGMIDRESHRLEQSIIDIIELSKIQEQRIDVSKRMMSIYDILVPIKKRYKEFCEDVGIHFSIDSSVLNLPDLYTNSDRIIQLLQILLDNAAKFTAADGTISIRAEYNDKQAILCIRDTGCGMDEETISHIFERFYRGNNTEEYAGSGLGLSIAKEIVNALDEKIWAESRLGEGTSFYFTISRKKRHWR